MFNVKEFLQGGITPSAKTTVKSVKAKIKEMPVPQFKDELAGADYIIAHKPPVKKVKEYFIARAAQLCGDD